MYKRINTRAPRLKEVNNQLILLFNIFTETKICAFALLLLAKNISIKRYPKCTNMEQQIIFRLYIWLNLTPKTLVTIRWNENFPVANLTNGCVCVCLNLILAWNYGIAIFKAQCWRGHFRFRLKWFWYRYIIGYLLRVSIYKDFDLITNQLGDRITSSCVLHLQQN